MTIRTSISFSTQAIQNAVITTADINYFGNVSTYIQELIIKDQIERGNSREQLMKGISTKMRNIKSSKI